MDLKYNEMALKYALDVNLGCFDSIEIITNDIEIVIDDIQKYGKGYLNQWGYLNLQESGFSGIIEFKNAQLITNDGDISIKTKDTLISFVFAKEYMKNSKGKIQFIEDYTWYENH